MWVVKLGGSLSDSDSLPLWLEVLGCSTDVVVVPGGGPFADLVRETQVRWACSEQTAHDMAILGMRQYGLMLADLGALPTAGEPHELAAGQGRCTVWLPMPEMLNSAGVRASWDITSDSIAAWLAGRLQAANLLLIKYLRLPQRTVSCKELVSQGVVDSAFGDCFSQSGSAGWIVNPDRYAAFAQGLADPAACFTRIA